MLKMVIADDESLVRETLKLIIPWTDYNLQIVGEASNGEEAYNLCLKYKPDILLTDIKMPLMDGLEVAMKLREQNSETRIIIISGIEDFNYARTALEIEAEGYILKPIKLDEIKQVLKRVSHSITMERNKDQLVSTLKKQLEENINIVREKFFTNLLYGAYSADTSVQEKLKFFEIPLSMQEELLVSVLEIDNYNSNICAYSEEDKQFLSFSVGSLIPKLLQDYNYTFALCVNENKFVIVFNEKMILNERYVEVCENIQNSIKKLLNVTVSIGIGSIVESIIHISSSYRTACQALEYKFYTGGNSIINILDLTTGSETMNFSDIYNIENELIKYVYLGNSDETIKLLTEIFNNIKSTEKPIVYVQNLCAEILHVMVRTLYEANENIDTIVYSHQEISSSIFSRESIIELENYIASILTKISFYFSEKFTAKNSKVISDIKNYINKNYMFDISVTQIAEEVNLSPNYLSQVFKQEANQTITDYVRRVRMETAKELLMSRDLKILEVSEMVGFDNAHYFSTVFKKYAGIHPQKYRALYNSDTVVDVE